MKFTSLITGCALLVRAALAAKDPEKPVGFPAPLTMDNFKQTLQGGLQLVEFYSPYCSHCKHFAPTWEKTWADFHEEGESLGIGMAQVDCVASGDLCNQERINAYPMLKLYGPEGFIEHYPKGLKRKEEDIIKYMRTAAIEKGDQNMKMTSMSRFISTDVMVRILGEDNTRPQLISFWPSSDLRDLDEYDRSKFDTPLADDCLNFQRSWAIVSNQVKSMNVDVGHFNCLSNKQICEKLQLDMKKPHVMMVIPHTNVAKVIMMDESVYRLKHSDVITFAQHVTQVVKAPHLSVAQLVEDQISVSRLPHFDSLPVHADVSFVYVYDPETTTQEDFQLLPYLTETLSKYPHTHLYRSNDTKMLTFYEIQRDNFYRSVNYNATEPKREMNEQRFAIESMTTLPTLMAFRENSLLTGLYQSFAPNEIRDQFKVIDWINEIAGAPGFIELTEQNLKGFLKGGNLESKLAILFVDPDEDKKANEYQSNFVVGVHDYVDLRNQLRYERILEKRELKSQEVLNLKENKAKSEAVVKAMSKAIKYDKFADVVHAYVDLTKDFTVLSDLGIDTTRKFESGDVVILDRTNKYYYETDTYGGSLNVRVSPHTFRETLCVLNGVKEGKVKKAVRNSPFPKSMKWIEGALYERSGYGLFSYLTLALVLFLVVKKGPGLFKKQRRHDNLGILGVPPAKVD